MTYYTDPLVTLLHGDCIEVMATLPAEEAAQFLSAALIQVETWETQWTAGAA